MEKQDLTTGHWVVLRNGVGYTVLSHVYYNDSYLISETNVISLKEYSDGLTHKDKKEYDIIEVFFSIFTSEIKIESYGKTRFNNRSLGSVKKWGGVYSIIPCIL